MTSIQNSSQLFGNFLNAATQHNELVLGEAGCKAAPAKAGFVSRLVNWLSGGESSRKINVDTRQAFLASIQNAFGAPVAQMCVKELKFQPASKKPLSSREIHDVMKLVASNKALAAMQKELGGVVRAFNRHDAIFQPNRASFAGGPHLNSRDIGRFHDEVAGWAARMDLTHDSVSVLKQQMDNIKNLQKDH